MKSLLTPLAACFRLGASARVHAYRRGWLKSERARKPVISVGNLSVGGTGKTPIVGLIAQRLAARGFKVSILTRGYGRAANRGPIVIPPGAGCHADPREAGDEPALLARIAPTAAIIISADRVGAAKLAEEQFQVDVHILDDGFQHLAIHRDLDIVLIDVTQKLRKNAVLPAGYLREAPSALSRADIILLTRSELADASSVEAQVRGINSRAGIFVCSTRLREIVRLSGGKAIASSENLNKPVMAVCAIGNPGAFFSNLREWGAKIVAEKSFRDHHVYSRQDVDGIMLRAKQSGAAAVVMTEKDAIKFPTDSFADGDIPFAACSIEPEISNAAPFEEAILNTVAARRSGA